MATALSLVAVLLVIWIFLAVAIMVVTPVMIREWAPNWHNALTSLPAPTELGERSGWKNSWLRDSPDKRTFMPCRVSYSEHGVVVRDIWHSWHFLSGFLSKHYTMFIPWAACSNPREPMRDRFYATPLQRRLVELDVEGHGFSILVHPDAYPSNLNFDDGGPS